MSDPVTMTVIKVMLASMLAAIPLHFWTRYRLRAIGLYEVVRPSAWLQGIADPYPLRLVLCLRGRVGAADWSVIVAYFTLWAVSSVLFVVALIRIWAL